MINLLLLVLALFVQGGELRHVTANHAMVYYSSRTTASTAENYLSVVDQLCSDNSKKFKIESTGWFKVRLCAGPYEFSNLTGLDSVFSPIWRDGYLYVIAHGDLADPAYRAALEAGVIHGILECLRPNGAPQWLIYSAAVYESSEFKDCTAPPVVNVSYFSDLEEKIQSASTPAELTDLCFYLGTTGKFFDLKFGVGSMLMLVQEFQRETNFNEASNKLFHVGREQLENDWREFLASEAGAK